MRNQRKLLAILVIGVVLGALFITLILRGGGSGLDIALITVPNDAQLTFQGQNGTTYTSKGGKSIKLPVDSYSVTATKDGFKERKLKLVVKESGQKLVTPLQAESTEAIEWADKNLKKYQEAERVAGDENQRAGEKFRNENPILSKLPYNQGFYRIDYGQEGNNAIIYITADQPVGRVVALATIKEWGYEPANFDIRFRNFDNPFKAGDKNE